MFGNPYKTITDSQREFVREHGATFDDRQWTVDYLSNLFAPLHVDTMIDFKEAGELTGDGAGRIAAPHSSAALAINMFDVWRDRDLSSLAQAMGVDVDGFVGYEQPHDVGLDNRARPDVEFRASDGGHVAIEVKLREPYGSVSNPFSERYFSTPGLWDGLPHLRDLAERIADEKKDAKEFTTLHAAQLIKHSMGLRRSYGNEFTLMYLWHYVPSETGNEHITELAEFAAIASADIDFTSVTVAELLDRLDPEQVDSAWLDYMTVRYVTPTGP